MDQDAPLHFGPAENGLGEPVMRVWPASRLLGTCIEYAVTQGGGSCSSARSDHRTTESAADLVAIFDAMADSHRAAARARAEEEAGSTSVDATPARGKAVMPPPGSPRCAENVRRGQTVTQCSRKATRGLYCAQHYRSSTVDDFAGAPAGLEDAPDQLPF